MSDKEICGSMLLTGEFGRGTYICQARRHSIGCALLMHYDDRINGEQMVWDGTGKWQYAGPDPMSATGVGQVRATSEPSPVLSTSADGPTVHEQVIEQIRARAEFGLAKYGTGLRPLNGRDPDADATDELLDLWVYVEQGRLERAAMQARIAELERVLGAVMAAHVPRHWSGVRDGVAQVLNKPIGDYLPGRTKGGE